MILYSVSAKRNLLPLAIAIEAVYPGVLFGFFARLLGRLGFLLLHECDAAMKEQQFLEVAVLKTARVPLLVAVLEETSDQVEEVFTSLPAKGLEAIPPV